ncbi:MAG: hypothetical protein ISS87_01370 [Candidatus Pacebacteria bacterium]|nr:hypothetical protein [Candidatus Paceibacterota bacterium]
MQKGFVSEYFHTYNRGVEKRKVFLDKGDFLRGVHDLYEFNDVERVVGFNRRKNQSVGYPISDKGRKKEKELLIDIIAWCLIPNHYHLFSAEKQYGALSKFQQKFGIGFTNYFNLKHKRSGVLFQGKHKKVHVSSDAQAAHLICYIHSNQLDLWKSKWKEGGLTSLEIKSALKFLQDRKNRWSSHQDYWGIQNFPSLISKEFLSNFFGGIQGYREFFVNWLKQYKNNAKIIDGIMID